MPNMVIVDLDSDTDHDSEDSLPIKPVIEIVKPKTEPSRVAKKSTASSQATFVTKQNITRSQAALKAQQQAKQTFNDRFMENFDPETSAREKKKLNRKLYSANNAPQRKVIGSLYDEDGVHVATGIDLCDCLQTQCIGCHFPCPKCNSEKCGLECRSNRKYIYDQVEFNGCDLIIKNPLLK